MSAQPLPQRRSWLTSLVARVEDYVFEPVEAEPGTVPPPIELKAHPTVAVVSAAPRSGASTVARLLAAELAVRADGAALVLARRCPRRGAPASRPALRVAAALTAAGPTGVVGRLCVGSLEAREPLVDAARYLAPVVFDVPPDGSAASIAPIADAVVVVAGDDCEPALLDAVAGIVGREARKVASRVADAARWSGRADFVLPESRLAARSAWLGACAVGALGTAVSELADSVPESARIAAPGDVRKSRDER